jgi:hypothetical protein
MTRGTLSISRELVEHPALQRDPYDQRSAWVSLLCEAAWAPRTKIFGATKIELARSELIGSSRYLAQKWSWGEPKVRRFLDRLQAEGMISRRVVRNGPKDPGLTVIGIVNFDRWQTEKTRRASDAPPDAAPDAPLVVESPTAIEPNNGPSVVTDAPPDAGVKPNRRETYSTKKKVRYCAFRVRRENRRRPNGRETDSSGGTEPIHEKRSRRTPSELLQSYKPPAKSRLPS